MHFKLEFYVTLCHAKKLDIDEDTKDFYEHCYFDTLGGFGRNQSPLYVAIMRGHVKISDFFLEIERKKIENNGCRRSSEHCCGRLRVHPDVFCAACGKGDIEEVKKLIRDGANLFRPDSSGCLPIDYAVYNDQLDVVKLILKSLGVRV